MTENNDASLLERKKNRNPPKPTHYSGYNTERRKR